MEPIKKKERKRQIQAANVTLRTDIGLDAKSKKMFDLIKAYARDVLGLKVSQSVIFRAALAEMFLTLIEQVYTANLNAKDKQELLERMVEIHSLNRRKFLTASGRDVGLDSPLDVLEVFEEEAKEEPWLKLVK
jgi:hypothetical protein